MNHRLASALLAAALALSAACGGVSLQAPPRDASADDRLAAYHRLEPAAKNAAGAGTWVGGLGGLLLSDGHVVEDPDDLLPVVGDDSVTARAARRAARQRRAKHWMIGISLATAAVGAAILVPVGDRQTSPHDRDRTWIAGGAILLVAPLIAYFGVSYYSRRERVSRAAAFSTYDASLRARLRLCTRGFDVIDCDAAAAAP